MKLLISAAIALLAFTGCLATSSHGSTGATLGSPGSTGASAGASGGTSTGRAPTSTGGTSAASSTGSSTGGSASGGDDAGNRTFIVEPTAGESFSSMSLSAAGGEAELFYAESQSGVFIFELQHLAASGVALGSPDEVAFGTPQQPPAVSVSSDGQEIACCWEDFGPDPNPYGGGGGPAGGESLPIVLCNSVPIGGIDTDFAMDGGFVASGHGPVTATSSGSTIVVFREEGEGMIQQLLYHQWGYGNGFGPSYLVTAWSAVPTPDGFDVFTSDGGQLDYTSDGLGIQFGVTNPVPIAGAGVGTFATASNGDAIGLLFREGPAIAATVLSADAGTVSTETVLSSAGDALAPAVAAATCASGEFGFAYALAGGNVMFREVGLDGSAVGAASTAVANLGATATGIALAPGDGGLLLAVGTADKIAIFGVACR